MPMMRRPSPVITWIRGPYAAIVEGERSLSPMLIKTKRQAHDFKNSCFQGL